MASALFRLIAAVGREMTVALTLGSFTLAILFSMSGFVLSKGIKDTELNILGFVTLCSTLTMHLCAL